MGHKPIEQGLSLLIVAMVGCIAVLWALGALSDTLLLLKSSRESYNFTFMQLLSSGFPSNGTIPKKFTCDGAGTNPELRFNDVPKDAASLALIVDDPDAPRGTFTHWVLWDIDPKTRVIKEHSVPLGSVEGLTSTGRPGYVGPCPPAGQTHRYLFKLYALDEMLSLPSDATRAELDGAIESHLMGSVQLVGRYGR